MTIKTLKLISFGKFKNKEISLKDGLNIIEGQNEAGKSTLAAFLRFMFYGLPSDRISKTNPVSAKEKYIPWGGDAISGSIELEDGGKQILIEREFRKSLNKKPVVRNKLNGEMLPEFTGSEPGEILFNVNSDTFEKTAFIRQNELEITAGEELEKKLRNLVSGGEEDTSYFDAVNALQSAIRKLEYNKKGLIPETEKRLSELREELNNAQLVYENWLAAQKELISVEEREKIFREQTEKLEKEYEAQKSYTASEKLTKIKECENYISEYESRLKASQEQLAINGHIPDEEYISKAKRLSQDLRLMSEKLKMYSEDVKTAIKRADEKKKLFDNYKTIINDEDTASDKVKSSSNTRKRYLLFGGVLALAAAAVALFGFFSFSFQLLLLIAACAFGLLGTVLIIIHFASGDRAASDKIAASYGYSSAEKLLTAVEEYKKLKTDIEDMSALVSEATEKELIQKEEYDMVYNELNSLCSLRGIDNVSVSTVEMMCAEIETLLSRINTLKAQIEAYKSKLSGLLQGTSKEELEKMSATDAKPDTRPILDIEEELSAKRTALQQLSLQAVNLKNRADSFFADGNTPDKIQTEINAQNAKRAALIINKTAAGIALSAINEAYEELHRIFAPELNENAGRLFLSFIGSKAREIIISYDNNVFITDDGLTRELDYYSTGTKDAAYLSVRLAVTSLIYGGKKPVLVFDDTFSHFDEERLCSAVKVLKAMSGEFQILLFTCRGNEAALCENEANIIKI